MEPFTVVLSELWTKILGSCSFLLSLLASPFSVLLAPYYFVRAYLDEENILYSAFLVCIVVALGCYIVSVITGNWSQVDRLWSILPIFYVWHFLLRSDAYASLALLEGKTGWDVLANPYLRVGVMVAFVTFWGTRLSYNFFRKGGYSRGHEDYRWPLVRRDFGWGSIRLQLFNFFFIALYQNILIFLFSLPIYGAVIKPTPLTPLDYTLFVAWLALYFLEVISDQQQFHFQNLKYRFIASQRPLLGEFADGFIQSGFFQYSRHPNFFAEFTMWWVYWLIQAQACTGFDNWLFLGPLLLTILFHKSTDFTEELSAKKYPKYAQYQQQVSRLIPWFSKRR